MSDIRILPESGLITLKELADYLEIGSDSAVQDVLVKNNIKVLRIGQRYKHRLVSLSSISEYLRYTKEDQ